MMMMIKHLVGLWTMLATHSCSVFSETRFFEVSAGGSVTLPCKVGLDKRSPTAVGLVRSWLRPGPFFFKYNNTEFTVTNTDDKSRVSVRGEPSTYSVNVTISELSVDDTDRYHCQFVVLNHSSEDDVVAGVDDFFLLTHGPASDDVEWVDVCAGDSAEIPCVSPHGALEGVTLKRQRGRDGVELLYHSQQHRGGGGSFETLFPADRVHLSLAPGQHGFTYNLTLLQMQPEDSGRYSCQIIQQGKSDNIASLGRKVVFVSVQGGVCSCPAYSTLLFIACPAVVVIVLLLGVLLIYHVKVRRKQPSRPQPAIYEEMVGVQPRGRKQEEVERGNCRNFSVKSPCLENHYESPSGAPQPKE